jgi:hypothetical protein
MYLAYQRAAATNALIQISGMFISMKHKHNVQKHYFHEIYLEVPPLVLPPYRGEAVCVP